MPTSFHLWGCVLLGSLWSYVRDWSAGRTVCWCIGSTCSHGLSKAKLRVHMCTDWTTSWSFCNSVWEIVLIISEYAEREVISKVPIGATCTNTGYYINSKIKATQICHSMEILAGFSAQMRRRRVDITSCFCCDEISLRRNFVATGARHQQTYDIAFVPVPWN